MGERYLPLFNEDGSWIERPDLYLLVRMDAPDCISPSEVHQIYRATLNSDPNSGKLNGFEHTIATKFISQNKRLRRFAGQVVLEACRIAQASKEPPSAKKAIELTASFHRGVKPSTTLATFEREIRRGFQSFRDTAHLQAAMVYDDPSLQEIEGSEEAGRKFLARARAFQDFIDGNLISDQLRWKPWRVPAVIMANHEVSFRSLNFDERRLLGIL